MTEDKSLYGTAVAIIFITKDFSVILVSSEIWQQVCSLVVCNVSNSLIPPSSTLNMGAADSSETLRYAPPALKGKISKVVPVLN
jgi:hypothetical protein